jgi:hypothetical protein
LIPAGHAPDRAIEIPDTWRTAQFVLWGKPAGRGYVGKMPNIQQPEMRRSGKDPLVQDSAKLRTGGAHGGSGAIGPVPPGQQSPYGPQPPKQQHVGTPRAADQDESDAILVGGPRDATLVHAQDAALITVEVGGFIHRYIHTTAQREAGGRVVVVYNYDGEVRPD